MPLKKPTDFPPLDSGHSPASVNVTDAGTDMFANRLRKNLRHLARWARREDVTCYRIYDADIPEYAVAVDLYENWVHVQEYEAPRSIPPAVARHRLDQVMSIIPAVLELPPEQVFLKVRKRQRGSSQYEKLAGTKSLRFYEVREGPCRFLVNFDAYLDTGLFLDHRPTRRLLGEWAADRRFLNLFAYTATATVHAALGGARTTTSVDLSRTYLDWAERNLALNGISGSRHRLIQADCPAWLNECRDRFDLIFLDPPTFSNSKRMEGTLDIQRDHLELIRRTLRLLDSGGILIFSNNYHGFRLDRVALADLRIEDMTRRTIPPDFARHADIHHCWRIER